MLVLDMDDTLLTDNHTISKENRAMIAMAQAKGVEVVLASGRPTPAMTHYAKDLQNSYMISFNGAVVTDLKNDTVIFEQSLTKEQIHELHDYSLKMKTHIITYINDTIVSETHSEFIEVERSITGMPHELVSDFKAAVTSNFFDARNITIGLFYWKSNQSLNIGSAVGRCCSNNLHLIVCNIGYGING